MNREKLLLAAGCAAFLAAAGLAQPTAAPPPSSFKNLKIFPKDITREQLMQNMKFFAQSLGVRCTHCHVGVEGQPLSTFDFAADTKREKHVARSMLTMVHKINAEEFGIKDFSRVKVTCYTCHRGAVRPATFPPAQPTSSSPEGGGGGAQG